MASAAQFPVSNEVTQKVVSQPMQKKILQDVLDCIVQMKCEFFDNHQPINDDSVVLQRFCAKFEHLLQVGMREKVSLLGRKKDYWDYFCECLASSKGSNDGIKYVKSLGENKTSLGKGRAFIRFCLVHQRLADTLQQCVVHDKTKDWFLLSSVLLNKECQGLINSLYDLNSMHFDLSPRGYDLDSVWPSFANRKPGARGSWNVPPSRRSSITSMDTISQISMSIDTTEVDRLAKDLEVAHSVKSELIGQIGALQQEKEQVSQTAWTAQGERQALEHQLAELSSQHSELLDKYNNLDIEHVKLKLEREHKTKLHIDELRQMDEKVRDEEARRVSLLKAEEDIWKKEVKEEGERRKREIDRLQKDVETKTLEAEELYDRWSRQSKALKTLILDLAVKTDPDDLETCLVHLADHIKNLQAQVHEVTLEKTSIQASLQGELTEKGEQASILLGRCLEMERVQKDFLESQANLHVQITTYEMDLKKEQDLVVSLQEKLLLLNSRLEQKETELERVKEEKTEMERQGLEAGHKFDALIQENAKLRQDFENLQQINASLSQTQENKIASLEEVCASLKEKEQNNFELTKSVEETRRQVNLLQCQLTNLSLKILEKDEEIKLLQKNSDVQTTECQAVLENNKTALTETQEQLSKTCHQLELVSREAEEAGAGSRDLQEQLSSAQTEIVALKSLSSDLGEKCASLEAEVEELSIEGREKDAMIEETKAACDLIRMEFAATHESWISVTAEAEKLGIESKRIDHEREQRAVELAELKVEMENLKREMDCEKSRFMGLLQQSEGVKSSEGEKEEKIVNLVTELEKVNRDKDETAVRLGNTIVELTNKLAEKDEQLQSILSEKETLALELAQERNTRLELLHSSKQEVDTLNSSIHGSESKLRSLIVELQVEMEEVKKHHETEVVSFAERISHLESELSNKEILLGSRSLDYENKIAELKDDIAKLERSSLESSESICTLTAQLAVLTEEKEHLLTQTDAALEDALQIKSQLTETSEQLAVSYTQLENLAKEKNSLAAAAVTTSEELSKLQDENDEIRREIQDLKTMLQLAEDESQEMLRQKRAMELDVEDMQARVSRLVEEKSELTGQLDSYLSQTEFSTKVLEEALVESREALEQVKADKLGLQENSESLERERVELMSKQVKLEEEIAELRSSNQSLQGQISPAQGSEIENLRLELEEERRTVENLNEEILALQFQLSSEQMLKKDFSQTQHAAEDTTVELKSRISELEIILEQLEEECEQLRKIKETDSVQVHDVQKNLTAKLEECAKAESRLQQVESRLREELRRREKLEADMALLRRSYEKDIIERDCEIKELRSDNDQIKRQIIKLTKDKDSLWHKTDQLVTEQKRKVGEKWQDNAQVTNCPQCKAEFSLFVRKHHCRLCGRIYCRTCSDYWLDSPHSSKKVRVCKVCLDYHNNLDNSLGSTSLLDNESDDDAGNEDAVDAASDSSRNSSRNGAVGTRFYQTDDSKLKQKSTPDLVHPAPNPFDINDMDDIYDGLRSSKEDAETRSDAGLSARGSDAGLSARGSEDDIDDAMFQIVTQEEVIRSMIDYEQPKPAAVIPPNMTSSIILLADELESGEVNKQNEVWIKPGKTFAVPVDIETEKTVLHWEFTSQPKDIVFSVNYRANDQISVAEAEEIVAPCKCDSHKQTVMGELTAKKSGIYTLIFDNTYSRMTSKKIHYLLEYKKQS